MDTANNQEQKMNTEENPQAKSPCKIGRCLVAFFAFLFFAWLTVLTVLYLKLDNDYDTLRTNVDANTKNKWLRNRIDYARSMQEEIDRKLNHSEHSVRRYVNLLMKNSTDSKLRWLREEKSDKVRGTNHQLNTSLERVKEAVNSLIPALENLKLNLTSLTNSSDSKMRRFGRVVEKLKDRLVLAQNDLTHLNVSLHTELTKASNSTASTIENVRKELSTFSNFTASKIRQMLTDMNNTNTNIVNMWEMFSRQNTSHHSNVRYASAALASKLKDADEKFVNLRNFTATELRQFRNDLNNTQGSLGRARNEIVYFNKSIHSLLQGVAKSQVTSVKSIDERIRSFRKDFESNKRLGVTQQKTIDEKLSETKAEFLESLKGEKKATSALEKKMMKNEKNLKEQQHSQENEISKLRNEVNELRDLLKKAKNEASKRVNNPFILIIALVLSPFVILN